MELFVSEISHIYRTNKTPFVYLCEEPRKLEYVRRLEETRFFADTPTQGLANSDYG